MANWELSEIKLFYSLCGKKCDVIQGIVAVDMGGRSVFIDLKKKDSLEQVKAMVEEEKLKQDVEDMFYLYELFKEYDFLRMYACLMLPYYNDNLYNENIRILEEINGKIGEKCMEGGSVWGENGHICLHIASVKIIAKMNAYCRMWEKPVKYAPTDLLMFIDSIEKDVDKFVHDELAIIKVGILMREFKQIKQAYDECFVIRNDYLSEYGRARVLQVGYQNYEKAAVRFQHCIRLNTYYKAYCHLGDCYLKMQEWEKAVECFQNAYNTMEKVSKTDTVEFEDLLMVYFRCLSAGTILFKRIINLPKALDMCQKAELILSQMLDYVFRTNYEGKNIGTIKRCISEKLKIEVLFQNLYTLSQRLGDKEKEKYYLRCLQAEQE